MLSLELNKPNIFRIIGTYSGNMSKLDDLLGNKKEVVPVLDLSKIIVHSKDEYKRLCEKVPDYKMRPIKVG